MVPASPTALSVASTCTSASYNPIHDALDEAALRRAENAPSLEGVLANNVVDRIFLGDIVAAASRWDIAASLRIFLISLHLLSLPLFPTASVVTM